MRLNLEDSCLNYLIIQTADSVEGPYSFKSHGNHCLLHDSAQNFFNICNDPSLFPELKTYVENIKDVVEEKDCKKVAQILKLIKMNLIELKTQVNICSLVVDRGFCWGSATSGKHSISITKSMSSVCEMKVIHLSTGNIKIKERVLCDKHKCDETKNDLLK